MADVKKLAEELVSLTVKQVQELADVLKADYGIEPAAAAVVVAAGGGGGEAAAEKTAFDVILTNGGASKLNVVKVVKDSKTTNVVGKTTFNIFLILDFTIFISAPQYLLLSCYLLML